MKKRMITGLTTLIAASSLLTGSAGAQQIAFSTGDLTFKGDLRYRHEQISAEGAKQQDRQRIRARMNVTAVVAPKVNFVFGIASGSGDPVSSNETLTDGMKDIPFSIDLAYFDYTTPLAGLKVQGGKMKNPFYTAGKSQLIWDGDLNPEGLAAQYSRKGATEIFANGAMLWVQERSADKDSYILGGQGGVKQTIGGLNVTAGAGFFDYVNTKGYATFYDTAKNYGNTVDAGKKYVYDYQIVEAFGEIALPKAFIPLSFAVDYATNIASDVEDNQGYLVGVTAGKTTPGAFSGRAFYRYLEKDAVVGAYCDSDFGGGGTNNTGTIVGLDYQASKNITLGATFFMNEKGVDDGTSYNRLQLDTSFKF